MYRSRAEIVRFSNRLKYLCFGKAVKFSPNLSRMKGTFLVRDGRSRFYSKTNFIPKYLFFFSHFFFFLVCHCFIGVALAATTTTNRIVSIWMLWFLSRILIWIYFHVTGRRWLSMFPIGWRTWSTCTRFTKSFRIITKIRRKISRRTINMKFIRNNFNYK